jgi:CBS-domain-containing membrane protein
MRRLDVVSPEKSLLEAWTILTRTGGIAPVVNADGTPYGIVTGKSLFDFLRNIVGPHPKYRDMTIAELLDIPCREAAQTDIPKFQTGTRIKDVINRLLRLEADEYWVLDDHKRYLGVVRQRDLLNPRASKWYWSIIMNPNNPSLLWKKPNCSKSWIITAWATNPRINQLNSRWILSEALRPWSPNRRKTRA